MTHGGGGSTPLVPTSSSAAAAAAVNIGAPIHEEKHFKSSELVRDIILGMADGLTVPFALAAGLSGSSAAASIVVTAGLAEVAAGATAMGLGGCAAPYYSLSASASHPSAYYVHSKAFIPAMAPVFSPEIYSMLMLLPY
jgi:hypothetical protein